MQKGIIFDLGNTLIQFTGHWDATIREGAEAMADWYLKKKHIKLDGQALAEAFIAEREAASQEAQETKTEVSAGQSLHKALAKIEAPKSAFAMVDAAIKIYFAPEESAWKPYADAIELLKALQAKDYRLGLYSNATDDLLVQRLVNQCYLRPFLSPTFSSAAWGWRKPRPEPFQLIANRWQLDPQQMMMVGDSLEADILGAQQAGIPAIWLNRNGLPKSTGMDIQMEIQPVAVCNTLLDILPVLDQMP